MSSASSSLPPAPKGWTDVEEAVGTPIGRTRLLLCKAPLSAARFQVGASRAFTPAMLVQQQRDMGRQLKYVVQVSVRAGGAAAAAAAAAADADAVSDRSEFYDATTELRPHGCQFVHVQVDLDPAASAPGVAALDPRARPCPVSARSIEQFVRVLRGIMAATEAAEEHERKKAAAAAATSSSAPAAAASSSPPAPLPAYVAVHDLYGYNLCGFLLTCFLCEEYGMDIGAAVGDVADSRPPGIYVAALLQSLLARYNDPDEEALAGGMLAAAASGAPGNVEIAKLTCIPLIPELPRPDWHHLPWTWSGMQTQSTAATAAPSTTNASDDPAAAAAAAAPGEEFKRKIRKKAAPAVAPAPSISASPMAPPSTYPSSAAAAAASSSSAAAAAAAPKRPFAEFAPPLSEPANKRARVAAPPSVSVSASASGAASGGPRSPQPRFAVPPPSAPRSPQPLFHVQPTPPAPAPAPAAAAASSSNGTAVPDLVAQLKRDHPFLLPVRADKLPSLQAVLAQVFPPATAAKFKAGGSGDAFAFLRPPTLSSEVLKQMQHGPASSRAPYMLSWLPQHHPCLMLLLREQVYLVFDQQHWFLVPYMHFPKRKSPQDNVNNTLLLGELIVDPVAPVPGSAPSLQSRFLACDLLVMSQTPLLSLMGLEQRLQTMEVELIQPLKALHASQAAGAAAAPTAAPHPQPQLHIRTKAHFALAKVESVLHMKVPHVHEGVVLRMSGKEKDAAKSAGFHFVWRKNAPGDVTVDDLMQLAKKK